MPQLKGNRRHIYKSTRADPKDPISPTFIIAAVEAVAAASDPSQVAAVPSQPVADTSAAASYLPSPARHQIYRLSLSAVPAAAAEVVHPWASLRRTWAPGGRLA